MDNFINIYNKLNFLTESIRLQYTNAIAKNIKDYSDIDKIIDRIKNHEPIEYIFNIADFYGRKFYVDNNVLIPRIETEELVKRTLDFINSQSQEFTIIDIGTGSGCIVITLALETTQNHRFIAIDISENALKITKKNVETYNLQEKVQLINDDFTNLDFSKYENLIICANLPYIPKSRVLQKSVVNFEPHIALFGGENGDELILKLKNKLKNLENLKYAILETDNGIIEEVTSLLDKER